MKWYHSKPDCVMTLEQLLQGLEDMFRQYLNVLSLRLDFEKRAWKSEEAVTDYLHAKVALANRASIAMNEIADYIIEGIPDQNIRFIAKVRAFQTTEELVRAFCKLKLSDDTRRQKSSQ